MVAALIAAAGCDDSSAELAVDLKTDLLPGQEFAGVSVEVADHPIAPGEIVDDAHRMESRAAVGQDFVSGRRVAELSGLEPGTWHLRVILTSGAGRQVAVHESVLQLAGNFAVTVLITRSCVDVTCPIDGGDPSLTLCLGGRCVDPRCSPETPEHCGAPECADDGDCPGGSACAEPECVARTCLLRPVDARCIAGEYCDPTAGCVAFGSIPDGGMCAATEMRCTDALDDDCDGARDCEDSDCMGALCDDGDPCTEGDACNGATCAGSAMACDDGNPCTADSCVAGMGCVHMQAPDGAECGGTWQRCCGGACRDLTTDASNCGGCGLTCASGFGCRLYSGIPTCDCAGLNEQCFGGRPNWLCSTTYGQCACLLNEGCAPGQRCVVRDSGPDYCSY